MTPEERARNIAAKLAALDAIPCRAAIDFCTRALARAIHAAVAEEREACMRDMCPYCLQGEPIVEPAECIAMGHDSAICHPFDRDNEGRVTGHVGCAAAAIRARTPR